MTQCEMEDEARSQFTFYRSFFEAVFKIKNKAARAEAYDAICKYALFNDAPDVDKMSDAAAIAFMLIKPNLDASRRKAKSGKNGGTSKQTASKAEANGKQNGSKQEANCKQEEGESEKEKEKEREKEREKENECYPPNPLAGGSEKKKRFTPPTVEQVSEYCQEKGYRIDPEAFVAFYASKGWMVGKSPMKDWKSAVVTWTKSERQRIGNANTRSGYTSGVDRLAEMYREEFGNG